MLLEKKLLSQPDWGGTFTFSIPQWMADEARAKTKLNAEQFVAVLQNPSDVNRCRVIIELLGSALRAPGRVPIETLRVL